MKIVSTLRKTESSQLAVFACGCFWGVEQLFRRQFPGLVDVRVGYASAEANDDNSSQQQQQQTPSYEMVCSGKTTFAESIAVAYEPSTVSYESLVDFFFRMHDPTSGNSQGNDVGRQYRSALFTLDKTQQEVGKTVRERFQKEWYPHKPITTTIDALAVFVDGEQYHQRYLDKNPNGYHCAAHYIRHAPE